MNRDPNGVTEGDQLLNRGRPVDVGGNQNGPAPLLLEVASQFGGDSGFPDALQPGEHDGRGPGVPGEAGIHWPHELDKFILARLNEVLSWSNFDRSARRVSYSSLDFLA